jgi:hypothetical protein
MGRKIVYQPNVGNAPASGATATIKASELTQGPVVADIIEFTGAATLGDVSRIRVFAGSVPFINVDVTEYNQYVTRFSRTNSPIATTGHILPIYYYALDEKGQNERDNYQAPLNRYIEIDFGTYTATTEGMNCTSILTDQPTLYYPLLLGSAMGIQASQALRTYDPKMGGYIRGFGINTTGLTRLFWTISGVQLYNGIGGVSLLNQELAEDASLGTTGRSTDYIVRKVNPWYDMASPDNSIQLQTAGGWAGVSNEFFVYAVNPVGKAGVGVA